MDKTQFSRQLIVLRAVIDGYAGHARLLNSTSGKELEIRIQSPAGPRALYAALVTRCDEGYQGSPLGALIVDERGQATGAFSLASPAITPEIIAIVEQTEDDCRLAMSGFLIGAQSVNWADVRAAACTAVTSGALTGCVSDPGAGTPPASAELPTAEAEAGGASDATGAAGCAADAAGIDVTVDWPEEIAPLRDAFAAQSAVTPFAKSRYTFISIPATESQPAFLAGIRGSGGAPTRVAYAVYGDSPHTRPEGLECFQWRAADVGGYWIAYIDAATGEPVADDD